MTVKILKILHPCIKKEPQILIDTTALLNKVTEINYKFSPFPAGTLLVPQY